MTTSTKRVAPASRRSAEKKRPLANGTRAKEESVGDGEDGASKPVVDQPSSSPSTTPAEQTETSSSRSSTAFWEAVNRDPLAALVYPEPVDSFLTRIWEKRPAVFRAGEERRALVASAAAEGDGGSEGGAFFTKAALDALVERSSDAADAALLFGRDVCASRYRRTKNGAGARENLGGPFGSRVAPPALRKLYGSLGATLQVHQPQRWCDGCWRLTAALEARLGTLVGANSYFTPAGSQGLAPHWDDVEVFVLQVEGRKSWKVWSWDGDGRGGGKRGAPLASAPSGDLDERELGEPSTRVVLEPGDVLYLPRGTIHAAAADVVVSEGKDGVEGTKQQKKRRVSPSTEKDKSPAPLASHHVTLSSHQRWSLSDLACAAISSAAAVPPECCGCGGERCGCSLLPRSLRPGLPLAFLSTAGFERGALAAAAPASAPSASTGATASALARGLRDLADALESGAEEGGTRSLALVDGAADALAADFFASRLPPHPSQFLIAPERAPRAATDAVAARGRNLFRLVACDAGATAAVAAAAASAGASGVSAPSASGGGASSHVRILSCLRNDRRAHLVPPLPRTTASPSSGESDEGEESSGSGGSSASNKEGSGGSGGSEEEESEEEESDDEEEGDCSTLYPSSYSLALAQILASTVEEPVRISDVRLPTTEAKLGLAYQLWSEGVVGVVE